LNKEQVEIQSREKKNSKTLFSALSLYHSYFCMWFKLAKSHLSFFFDAVPTSSQ